MARAAAQSFHGVNCPERYRVQPVPSTEKANDYDGRSHPYPILGGTWHGAYGVAPGLICQPERRRDQTALTLADAPGGRLLAHCKKSGCSFRDLASALGLTSGDFAKPDPAEIAKRDAAQWLEASRKARQAEAVWMQSVTIYGTVAEAYLRGRGITCDLPDTLRFHPSCWHSTAQRFPVMVAKVEGGAGFAVHRTYLRPDGSGKAEVDPPKAMLAAVAGGAVRLSAGPGPLVAAEKEHRDGPAACQRPSERPGDDLGGPIHLWAAGPAPAHQTGVPDYRFRW